MRVLYSTNIWHCFIIWNSIVKDINNDTTMLDPIFDDTSVIVVNKKKLFTIIDKIVLDSINAGNLHFGISINFSKCINGDMTESEVKEKVDYLNNIIATNVELWTYSYIAVEFNENKKPHIHAIIAVRSVIGYNDVISSNLRDFIRKHFEYDTKLDLLKTIYDVYKFFKYTIKEIDKMSKNHKLCFVKEWQFIFADFLDYLNEAEYEVDYGYFFLNDTLKYRTLFGRVTKEKNYNTQTVLSFWLYYLLLNNLSIYNNYLFQKLDNYCISYKKYKKITFLYNSFNSKIFPFFLKEFKMHFENFDLYNFSISSFIKSEDLITKLKEITSNKIDPNFNILEFTDGIYYIKLNKFIPKKEFLRLHNAKKHKLATLKYYNKTFKHLTEPKEWLANIKEVLEYNETNVETLCKYIANVFHKSNILFHKKKVLFIKGESNTRKTTLIVKPLRQFFGDENVGYLNTSSEFTFQNITGKQVVLLDEFHYSSYKNKHRANLLKIFGGEPITINMKFAEPITINDKEPIVIIILSNEDILDENYEVQQALENRICKIYFKAQIKAEELNERIDDLLKEEEPNIIYHCNKIFYNELAKQMKIKRTRLTYEKVLSYILLDSKEDLTSDEETDTNFNKPYFLWDEKSDDEK